MKTLLTLILSLFATAVMAQSQPNLQNFTPSVLYKPGQWEFKNFNNLYTQQRHFSPEGGKEFTGRGRETYFSSINQFLYGLNSYLNIGLDVWVKNVNLEQSTLNNWWAVSGIGPKIKIAPFKSIPRLSIQSTLLFPLANDLEGRAPDNMNAFLEHDRTLWMNQVFYDQSLGSKFQIFLQQAFWYSMVRDSFRENNYLQTPTSAFLSYFPNQRVTLYAMSEFWPTHYDTNQQQTAAFHSYFLQSGGGVKYQLVPGLIEMELLYTNFWMGSDFEGAGETFNLGIRVIR